MNKTLLLIFVAVSSTVVYFSQTTAATDAQPNIIVFLVDDMGVMDSSV